MTTPTRRPAHRPSRRGAIVATALELIAESQADAVTIADIAAAAKMTPAAIYYHYPSRDAILLEGFQTVSASYRAAVDAGVERVKAGETVACTVGEILTWAKSSPGARAYVLSASGLSSSVEAVLRADQIYAVEQFRVAVKAARPGVRAAESSVLAVALLSLISAAVASMLTLDRARKGLSESRFRAEVEALAEGIITPPGV
jgi:AcrR family transcriptional regulator